MGRGKIITTLRQRREIEEQIRELVNLKSQDDIFHQIERIVEQGEQVVPTLVANLDTTDPHLRGALGLIASRLPHDIVGPALRSAAMDVSASDQARLTAAMILERFLHEEVSASLLTGLGSPDEVAMQSLVEVTAESGRDRGILIEYIRSLEEQPLEVAMLVLQALEQMPPENQIEILRMLAQDGRQAICDTALAMLARHRTPQAYRALQILLIVSPPHIQPTVERALRKLSLAGIMVDSPPEPDPSWRALVSAVDGQGNQSIWFLQRCPDSGRCRFLSVLINDRDGLSDAFGGDDVGGQQFPNPAPLGTLHGIPLQHSTLNLNLLEADFDYGRRLVFEGMQSNFESGTPLPIEYRLLNDLLWGYATEGVETPPLVPAFPPEGYAPLLAESAKLLDSIDFATWFVQSPAILRYAEELYDQASPQGTATIFRRHLLELAEDYFADEEIRILYARRLRMMSEWLLRSEQEEAARQALAAATAMQEIPPSEHPFVIRLIQASLSIALTGLGRGPGPDPSA